MSARRYAGDPEIPPTSPPETPPEQVPLGIPPGGPTEVPEPPSEIPPATPPEVLGPGYRVGTPTFPVSFAEYAVEWIPGRSRWAHYTPCIRQVFTASIFRGFRGKKWPPGK